MISFWKMSRVANDRGDGGEREQSLLRERPGSQSTEQDKNNVHGAFVAFECRFSFFRNKINWKEKDNCGEVRRMKRRWKPTFAPTTSTYCFRIFFTITLKADAFKSTF